MSSAFRPAILVLLAWLNACRPEPTADAPPSFEPTTLTTSLIFSLGAADSQESVETFFRVFSGFIDEGAIHIADGGSLEVRAYDMVGNFLRSAGGPGAGPGEFANLRWITAKADSLVVLDARAGRVSLFDAGGTFVRSFLLPVDNHGQAEWIESRNDSFLVAFGTGLDPRGLAGAARDSLDIVIIPDAPSEGESQVPVEARLARVGNRWWRPKSTPTSFGLSGVMDGPMALISSGGGAVWVTENDGHELISIRPGRLPIHVPMAGRTTRGIPISSADGIDARLYEQLVVAEDGLIWLSDFEPDGGVRPWTIFDDTGRIVHRLSLPVDLRILDVKYGLLLDKRVDTLGVESIELRSVSEVVEPAS